MKPYKYCLWCWFYHRTVNAVKPRMTQYSKRLHCRIVNFRILSNKRVKDTPWQWNLNTLYTCMIYVHLMKKSAYVDILSSWCRYLARRWNYCPFRYKVFMWYILFVSERTLLLPCQNLTPRHINRRVRTKLSPEYGKTIFTFLTVDWKTNYPQSLRW